NLYGEAWRRAEAERDLVRLQVPTTSGDVSLRSAATTLNGVITPVRGFSADGIFSIVIVSWDESDFTSIVCVLCVTVGSAQTSTSVRSGPMPARDSATDTLRFAGKPFAASRAVPENTF